MIRNTLRQILRQIGIRFPYLRRFQGKLGLGRLLSSGASRQKIIIDEDIVVELDLSLASCRAAYFVCDPVTAPETILCRCLLKPPDIFADVGANFGYFTLVAAKYAGHVFAFEPSPQTYAYCENNLRLNQRLAPKITGYMMGLAAEPGQMKLYRPAQNPGLASLRPVTEPDTVEEVVKISTLDNILGGQPVSFIKIDVEGAELDVLQGAGQTIQKNRPLVLLELFEPHQHRFDRTCQDVVTFFQAHRYHGYRIRQNLPDVTLSFVPLDLNELAKSKAIENVLFTPVERAAEIPVRIVC